MYHHCHSFVPPDHPEHTHRVLLLGMLGEPHHPIVVAAEAVHRPVEAVVVHTQHQGVAVHMFGRGWSDKEMDLGVDTGKDIHRLILVGVDIHMLVEEEVVEVVRR